MNVWLHSCRQLPWLAARRYITQLSYNQCVSLWLLRTPVPWGYNWVYPISEPRHEIVHSQIAPGILHAYPNWTPRLHQNKHQRYIYIQWISYTKNMTYTFLHFSTFSQIRQKVSLTVNHSLSPPSPPPQEKKWSAAIPLFFPSVTNKHLVMEEQSSLWSSCTVTDKCLSTFHSSKLVSVAPSLGSCFRLF